MLQNVLDEGKELGAIVHLALELLVRVLTLMSEENLFIQMKNEKCLFTFFFFYKNRKKLSRVDIHKIIYEHLT